MRQVNFTLIFVICLALVLFGLENSQPTSVKLIEGIELKAPLSIALVVTLGIGALLAGSAPLKCGMGNLTLSFTLGFTYAMSIMWPSKGPQTRLYQQGHSTLSLS